MAECAMKDECRVCGFPAHTEYGNLQVAASTMANGLAALGTLINGRHAQLSADSAAMWSINMTTPSQMNALALRTASESGSGRTRVESNTPAGDQTTGGGGG